MTKDEALDLALEALEELQPDDAYPYSLQSKAITAIKQARALDKKAENARKLGLDYEPVWDNLPSNKDVEDAMKMKRLNQLATTPGGRQSEDCLTAAQEDIQRLSALVRAQQITIDKLEQDRSAPVQEPYGYFRYDMRLDAWVQSRADKRGVAFYTTPPAQPAPVQEPVAWVRLEAWQSGAEWPDDCFTGIPADGLTPLYTTPPAAQRQWVGLTDDEIDALKPFADGYEHRDFARAIEAKLKDKNGLHRQHVIDGSPCWCEPETSYTDPETGASVVVHKEPQ